MVYRAERLRESPRRFEGGQRRQVESTRRRPYRRADGLGHPSLQPAGERPEVGSSTRRAQQGTGGSCQLPAH